MTISADALLSEILRGEPIPAGTLAYFSERLKNRYFNLIVGEFLDREAFGTGPTRAEIARRLKRRPEQITRWLSTPGNWTLDTVSNLLLAICASEPVVQAEPVQKAVADNYPGADWLYGQPVTAPPRLDALPSRALSALPTIAPSTLVAVSTEANRLGQVPAPAPINSGIIDQTQLRDSW